MKIPVKSASWGQLDWLRELDTYRESATKLRVVTVEGVICDEYEHSTNNISTRVWISQTNGFPVRAVWRVSRGSATMVASAVFKKVELNPELSDDLFRLPASVTFTLEPK